MAEITANEVKTLLGLQPHPQEGGWYVRTWESAEFVAAEAFGGGNSTSKNRDMGRACCYSYKLSETWLLPIVAAVRSVEPTPDLRSKRRSRVPRP